MVAISSIIVELTDDVGNSEGMIKRSTNQRTLLPDPATNAIHRKTEVLAKEWKGARFPYIQSNEALLFHAWKMLP